MTYYHPSRDAAQTVADEIMRTDDRVAHARPELEPDNGWVVVVQPRVLDITDLGDRFEVRHPNGTKLSHAPANKVRYKPPAAKAKSSGSANGGPTRPSGGITARVHAIGDKLKAEGKLNSRADRKVFAGACKAEGIADGTIGVQVGKWFKNNGY